MFTLPPGAAQVLLWHDFILLPERQLERDAYHKTAMSEYQSQRELFPEWVVTTIGDGNHTAVDGASVA